MLLLCFFKMTDVLFLLFLGLLWLELVDITNESIFADSMLAFKFLSLL